MPGIDLWDAPDVTCKSCGYDGGFKHAKAIHDLQMEKAKLDGLNNSEKENVILFPIVAKIVATVIITITLSIASCGIFSSKPPTIETISNEYSSKTLDKMKEIYELCQKDPVATPADCNEAMRAIAGDQKGPAQ